MATHNRRLQKYNATEFLKQSELDNREIMTSQYAFLRAWRRP